MRFAYFSHSLVSDWNHGNAHFLRGLVSELLARGHEVRVHEPANGWSRSNLVREHGTAPLERWKLAYPGLTSTVFDLDTLELDRALDDADVVLVHEWNDPLLVARLGEARERLRSFVLLFHDTHHRAVTDPAAMSAFDLRGYDGVLTFGAVLTDLYLRRGWIQQAFTFHEAADVRVFRSLAYAPRGQDLVWIGNWGDEERTAELHEFLIAPARALRVPGQVFGVRYPPEALEALAGAGLRYGGWVANFDVPRIFAQHKVTLHVPRRPYATRLPGIPTIRVFEALACGIPLISAPWDDCEGLFEPGRDFLVAQDGAAMKRHLEAVLHDAGLRSELAARGQAVIAARHTCGHRVDQLLGIVERLRSPALHPDGTAHVKKEDSCAA